MQDLLWTFFGWISKGIGVLMFISVISFFASFIWNMVTNGGRKWYYYNPSKPWKGGYWSPILPDYPPYNEYRWNPDTARFEYKETGEPLHSWKEPITRKSSQATKFERDWDAFDVSDDKPIELKSQPYNKRPEWLRFLLDENMGTLIEKRKRKKWAEQIERENGARK